MNNDPCDPLIVVYKIGAGGCERRNVKKSRAHNDESAFASLLLCTAALTRQTLLDKVFKCVENQPEIRRYVSKTEELKSRIDKANLARISVGAVNKSSSSDPPEEVQQLVAEMEQVERDCSAMYEKYGALIITPVALLKDAEITRMADAVRPDNVCTTLTLARLCETFYALFPQYSPPELVARCAKGAPSPAPVSDAVRSEDAVSRNEMHQLRQSIAALQLKVEYTHSLLTKNKKMLLPDKAPRAHNDTWSQRLRKTGRRRRVVTVLLENMKESDIVLQRLGPCCEVSRIY